MSIVLIYNPVPAGATVISFYNANNGGGTVNFQASNPLLYNVNISLSDTGGVNQIFSYNLSSSTPWPGGQLRVSITATGSITEFGSTAGIIPNSNQWLNSFQSGLSTLTKLAYAFASSPITIVRRNLIDPTILTGNVTDMRYTFYQCTNFNGDITGWNTGNVTDMTGMFEGATLFNQNISGWNTANVTNMTGMFNGALSFNQNIGGWNISSITLPGMTNMLNNTNIDSSNFDSILNGWANPTLPASTPSNITLGAAGRTYTTTGLPGATYLVNTKSWKIVGASGPPIPCFGKDTKILCLKDGCETYIPVNSLKKGDLVKTYKNGFLKIDMIGKSQIYNTGLERIPNRLYLLKMENYPELIEDLLLTGYHSLLIDFLTPEQERKTIELMKKIYITDGKYRLVSCLDDKAIPYNNEGFFEVYHIALENENYFTNYGVYANGLLVETCSKRFLKELSQMELII